MKRVIVILLLLGLIATPALAANTVTYSYKAITIVPDGSTDWDVQTYFPNGIQLCSIAMQSSAANDKLAMEEGSATGARLTPGIDITGGGMIWYFDGSKRFPYLDASDCTFSTAASVKITITYR